ncbi:MAG TPA: tetratricopeptide repeat protein [Candidatus Acidoferrum sp.]|jgi:hypothetical protein
MKSVPSFDSARTFASCFFRTAALALFAWPWLIPRANAQDAQKAAGIQPSPCVSPAMAQLLTREANSIRVRPNIGFAAQQPGYRENEKGIALTQSQDTARTLREAYTWFENAARKGYAPAQVNLAVLSLAGWGAPPNAGDALYWLREAARQGYALAYFDLGVLYLQGCGVRQDYTEAFIQFEQGANAGDPAAQMNLAYLYDQGLGVAQNRARAAALYRQAADAGLPQAQYNLADLYLRGEGVPQDDRAAFALFQKAAQQGHTTARTMLGMMYAQGRGTKPDPESAYAWLTAAAQQGDTRCEAALVRLERKLTATQIAEAKSRAQNLTQPASRPSQLAVLH